MPEPLDSFVKDRVRRKTELRELQLSYEELLQRTASAECDLTFYELAYEKINGICETYESCLDEIQAAVIDLKNQNESSFETMSIVALEEVKRALEMGAKFDRSRRATTAANARHSRLGESREKQRIIREIWASGKYSSRDICAEQECGGLDMSFSSARKALRNTPNP